MFKIKTKSGHSLVEMLIYVGILSIVSILVVSTLLSFTKSYRDLGALRIVEHSGINSMERMIRDITNTTVVDVANSSFDTNPGVLTIIATANSVSTTTKFYVENNILKVNVNGIYSGPLSLSNASISNLVFKQLDSGISKAIKIDMTIQGVVGGIIKTRSFHSTVILTGL